MQKRGSVIRSLALNLSGSSIPGDNISSTRGLVMRDETRYRYHREHLHNRRIESVHFYYFLRSLNRSQSISIYRSITVTRVICQSTQTNSVRRRDN